MSTSRVGVAGKYIIRVIDSETGLEKQTHEFDNLITNIGLDRLGQGAAAVRCHVGTGTATPAFTDVGLQTPLAETATVQSSTGNRNTAATPYWASTTRVFRFTNGAAVGTWREIGIFWATGNTTCFSRALLPTELVVGASDIVDVSYEFRYYPPETDTTFNVTIAGITHACVVRPASMADWAVNSDDVPLTAVNTNNLGAHNYATLYNGDLGTHLSSPAGQGALPSTPTTLTYVAGSYRRVFQIDAGLTQANLAGGIKSIRFDSTMGEWQCSFTPPIAKDATKTLRLNVAVTWARR